MAVEVTIVVRFEHEPEEDRVRSLIEDTYADADVQEYESEEV